MGVSHNLTTGKTYIDGVEVTVGNQAALVAGNVRREVLGDLGGLIRKAEGLWPGVTRCPERERIVGLLRRCETDIKGG